MSKIGTQNKNIAESSRVSDGLLLNHSRQVCRQIAGRLFDATMEDNRKGQFSSSENMLIKTFYYSTSKEELCEALSCSMAELYKQARALGVVSARSQHITSATLLISKELFKKGLSQDEVLSHMGLKGVSNPVEDIPPSIVGDLEAKILHSNPEQISLEFGDED